MRKLSWMLLVLLVLVGCGEEITKEEVKPKTVVETEPPYGLNGRTYRNKNLVSLDNPIYSLYDVISFLIL